MFSKWLRCIRSEYQDPWIPMLSRRILSMKSPWFTTPCWQVLIPLIGSTAPHVAPVPGRVGSFVSWELTPSQNGIRQSASVLHVGFTHGLPGESWVQTTGVPVGLPPAAMVFDFASTSHNTLFR